MATGLGGEQLWLSPTVANNVNPYDDQSGQGNNGTNNGSTVVSDTSSGGTYAFDFDGTNDYIDCGSGFNPTTSLSLTAWVNADTWSGDPTGLRNVIASGFDGSTSKFDMIARSNGSWMDLYSYTSGTERGIESKVAPPSISNWHHMCGTFDGSTWRLFYDGVQVASDADATPLPANIVATFIGATKIVGSPQRYFSGKMDDIRTYNRTLTQAEITHLATSRGVLGPPGGATHYNPFKTHAFTNNFQQRLR